MMPQPTEEERKEMQERADACLAEVDAILQKYNCRVVGSVVLGDNNIKPMVTVTANPFPKEDPKDEKPKEPQPESPKKQPIKA